MTSNVLLVYAITVSKYKHDILKSHCRESLMTLNHRYFLKLRITFFHMYFLFFLELQTVDQCRKKFQKNSTSGLILTLCIVGINGKIRKKKPTCMYCYQSKSIILSD